MEVDVAKTVDVYERVEVVDSDLTECVGDGDTVFVGRTDGEPVEELVDVLEGRGNAEFVPDLTCVCVLTVEPDEVMETLLVFEGIGEPDRVVEAVVVFERGADLLAVRDASRLLVFIVAVVQGVCVMGAVSVCAKLSEGLIEIPGGTERVKDVDGVGHDDKELVAETVGLFERKGVGL